MRVFIKDQPIHVTILRSVFLALFAGIVTVSGVVGMRMSAFQSYEVEYARGENLNDQLITRMRAKTASMVEAGKIRTAEYEKQLAEIQSKRDVIATNNQHISNGKPWLIKRNDDGSVKYN